MIFFDCNVAPSPRLVRIFIAEKNAKVEVVNVDLRNGEHLEKEFRQINSYCTVPVIKTKDGLRIASTQGCWRYLEEFIPDPPLLGSTIEEKAIISDLIWHIEMDGFQAVAEGLRNSAPRLKNRAITGQDNFAQNIQLGERGKIRTKLFLDRLDDRLGDKKYMAGDVFTAVDILTFVTVDFAGWLKIKIPESATRLLSWYDRISARPSSKL